jgi:hypothetical protein
MKTWAVAAIVISHQEWVEWIIQAHRHDPIKYT